MGVEAYFVIAILAAAVLAFSLEWPAPEVVAVLVLVMLVSTGILSPQEGFVGFSSSAVIAIGSLLAIGAGLVRTGVVKWIAERLAVLAGTGFKRLLLVSTMVPGILSGFINIVAAVSIFIPAVLRLARRSGLGPKALLLPMAVSGLLGANLSLIGASHNLVVNSLLEQETKESFGFFEFAPVGIILLLGIVLYSFLSAGFFRQKNGGVPGRDSNGALHHMIETYRLNDRLWELMVLPNSDICCRHLEEIGLGRNYGLNMLMILRQDRQLAATNEFTVAGNDLLAISGRHDRIEDLIRDYPGLVLMGQPEAEKDFTWSAFDLVEVVIPPRSRLIGKTLRQALLRRETGMIAIALWRGSRPYRTDVRDRELAAGDGILLFGSREHVRDFRPQPDFLWLHKPRPQEAPLHLRKYAPAAALIFLAVVVSAALDWLSVAIAALAGAAAMNILGILNPKETYKSIDWRTLILIGGMYPVGTALQKTGAAGGLADLILAGPGAWGGVPALVAVGLLTLVLTQPMHNAVAALIMTPIALQVAEPLGANPKAFALAVVVGASASFLMPVGHPAPLLVQKPGGYQSLDYLKFGSGATVLVLLVIAVAIPLLWPL